MRIEPELKADLKELAAADRRDLTDYVKLVLSDHVASRKREAKRK